jgi:1-acyl-sn-glycerol-3-phosphate acyltransferase
MSKIFKYFYFTWYVFWFVTIFLLLFPFTFIFLQKQSWKKYAHVCNQIWATSFLFFCGIKLDVKSHFKPKMDETYVFVSNHFSFLDIPAMVLVVKNYLAFIGKGSLRKLPLFGYMFAKLYIFVERSDKNSRAISMTRSIKALQNKRSLMVFAEGGIFATPPKMVHPFKDGAFSMAIQQQVPIVPVALLNNHIILPVDTYFIKPSSLKAEIFEPISTIGLTQDDMESLKEKTWQIIQKALINYDTTLKNS